MVRKIHYADRRNEIIAILQQCANEGRTITYGELGEALGIPPRGPWKPILDDISRGETAEGRPDISYLVVSKRNGLPGQIGFEAAKPPTDQQRRLADKTISEVFNHYRGGSRQ